MIFSLRKHRETNNRSEKNKSTKKTSETHKTKLNKQLRTSPNWKVPKLGSQRCFQKYRNHNSEVQLDPKTTTFSEVQFAPGSPPKDRSCPKTKTSKHILVQSGSVRFVCLGCIIWFSILKTSSNHKPYDSIHAWNVMKVGAFILLPQYIYPMLFKILGKWESHHVAGLWRDQKSSGDFPRSIQASLFFFHPIQRCPKIIQHPYEKNISLSVVWCLCLFIVFKTRRCFKQFQTPSFTSPMSVKM